MIMKMPRARPWKSLTVILGFYILWFSSLQAADRKPNILFIVGDDVGWFNIGAYHGMMSGKTPNLDRLARGFTTE